MLTLDQIVYQLQDRKLDAVAKATDIHRNTLAAIRDGRSANPHYKVMQKLSDYFDARNIA